MGRQISTHATAVIQARVGSTRLPGKVLTPLAGRSVLSWVVRAARAAQVCDDVVVATTALPEDDAVADAAAAECAGVVRGDVDDVLGRFMLVLADHPAAAVVRLTADCPLLDPGVIAMAVRAFDADEVDYLSTVTPRSLPHGLDVEVVSPAALRLADAHAAGADRTHVTSWLYREPGRARVAGLTFAPSTADLRVTLDTPADLEMLRRVVALTGDRVVPRAELVGLLRAHPDIARINADVRHKALDEG